MGHQSIQIVVLGVLAILGALCFIIGTYLLVEAER